MHFEELSIEGKVEATINYIENRRVLEAKGRKDADQYLKDKSFHVKKMMKAKKANTK